MQWHYIWRAIFHILTTNIQHNQNSTNFPGKMSPKARCVYKSKMCLQRKDVYKGKMFTKVRCVHKGKMCLQRQDVFTKARRVYRRDVSAKCLWYFVHKQYLLLFDKTKGNLKVWAERNTISTQIKPSGKNPESFVIMTDTTLNYCIEYITNSRHCSCLFTTLHNSIYVKFKFYWGKDPYLDRHFQLTTCSPCW